MKYTYMCVYIHTYIFIYTYLYIHLCYIIFIFRYHCNPTNTHLVIGLFDLRVNLAVLWQEVLVLTLCQLPQGQRLVHFLRS